MMKRYKADIKREKETLLNRKIAMNKKEKEFCEKLKKKHGRKKDKK